MAADFVIFNSDRKLIKQTAIRSKTESKKINTNGFDRTLFEKSNKCGDFNKGLGNGSV